MTNPDITALRILIETGAINTFKETFDYLTVDRLAEISGLSPERIQHLKDDLWTMTGGDILQLTRCLDMDRSHLVQLICNQLTT